MSKIQSMRDNTSKRSFSQPNNSRTERLYKNHNVRDVRIVLSQSSQDTIRSRNSLERNWRSQSMSYEDNSQSQKSSQSERSPLKNMTSQEENELISTIIKYLFAMDKTKHVIPRTHIIKNIFNGSSKNYSFIMAKVKTTLSEVFGYKLIELNGGKYILSNEFKCDHLSFSDNERAEQVLLFIVLAHIFMCENSCKEAILWDFLRELDIINDDNLAHKYFGNVRHLITTDFVSQQYITKVMVEQGDSQKYEFEWGPRAKHEVAPRDVLNFVSQVYGGQPIENWPVQYQNMMKFEQENL